MENVLVKIFAKEEFGKVRVIFIDGKPWFAGKDVALALGYKDTDSAIRKNVPQHNKRFIKAADLAANPEYWAGLDTGAVFEINSPNGLLIINKSGLFALMYSSRLPKAEEFRNWITDEVLPSIDETGSYSLPNDDSPADSPPEFNKREKIAILMHCAEMTNLDSLRNPILREVFYIVLTD